MYLYVFQGDEICRHRTAPTDIDKQCIGLGTLRVFSIASPASEVNADGSTKAIPACELYEDADGNPYHAASEE